jgi:hypothetical protein
MSVPAYVTWSIIGDSVAVVLALMAIVKTAALKAGWPNSGQSRAVSWTTVVLVGWFTLALVLGTAGVYQAQRGRIPTIGFGLFLPIIAGVLVAWLVPSVRRLLEHAPQHWLVGVQFYRVLGGLFLVLLALGELPREFALPAGIGDVLVGLAAPLVAMAYARRPDRAGWLVAVWNALGLLDLTVAVTTGVLTAQSPLQLLAFDRPNVLVGLFPLVLVPTYLVPISILLHLGSLSKLRRPAPVACQMQAA